MQLPGCLLKDKGSAWTGSRKSRFPGGTGFYRHPHPRPARALGEILARTELQHGTRLCGRDSSGVPIGNSRKDLGEILAGTELAKGGEHYKTTGSQLVPVDLTPTLAQLGLTGFQPWLSCAQPISAKVPALIR
jgi:hypothetical protein